MFLLFHTTHITRNIFGLKMKDDQLKHEVQLAVRIWHMINNLFLCTYSNVNLQLKKSQF